MARTSRPASPDQRTARRLLRALARGPARLHPPRIAHEAAGLDAGAVQEDAAEAAWPGELNAFVSVDGARRSRAPGVSTPSRRPGLRSLPMAASGTRSVGMDRPAAVSAPSAGIFSARIRTPSERVRVGAAGTYPPIFCSRRRTDRSSPEPSLPTLRLGD